MPTNPRAATPHPMTSRLILSSLESGQLRNKSHRWWAHLSPRLALLEPGPLLPLCHHLPQDALINQFHRQSSRRKGLSLGARASLQIFLLRNVLGRHLEPACTACHRLRSMQPVLPKCEPRLLQGLLLVRRSLSPLRQHLRRPTANPRLWLCRPSPDTHLLLQPLA